MIAKLTCDQIAEIWPIIKEGIQVDLQLPTLGRHKYRESNVLESLLAGTMNAWTAYEWDEDNESVHLYMIALTSIYTDPVTKNKCMYIFSILWFRDPPKEVMMELRNGLVKYAKEKNCHTLSSMTNRPELVQLAKSMDIDTSFNMLIMDLEKE
jgi:hypothetical protein